jgi:oligosaccharide 4-alpha-D-glucosyltransferase
MNKLLLLFIAFFSASAIAQRHGAHRTSQNATAVGFSDENGQWQFEIYPGDIIKTTFIPKGYAKHELVSNAVILQPLRSQKALEYPLLNESSTKFQLDKNVRIEYRDKLLRYFVNNQAMLILDEPVQKEGFNSFVLRLFKDEKIFGGGERAIPLDRRGYKFNLYNAPAYGYEYGEQNLNFSVPFFISSKGYGIFFDNPSKGYVDIGKTNPAHFEAAFTAGQLNFYLILGKTTDEIMRKYTALTGRQSIPPRWAFGNFMSRFGYTSEEQVKEIYNNMKADSFPMDAVIFDLFWFGDSIKGTMGNLDWMNKTKWPDPKRMIDDFKKDSIKTILITEPFILESTPNYQPSVQYHSVDSAGKPFVLTDFYFGRGGLIDIFRNDAQDWFWEKYQKQISNGVAGWWGDLGEPEKHPSSTYHNLKDLGFSRTFAADEVHNLYGHYWSKMLHEKYAQHYPGTRLFHLNRSGFAGSQRYNAFPWTGDVHRNWKGFEAQLPILLSMSLCGIPYIHSDAGGFAMGQRDPELYTRWLQFAAFTPVFRPHGTALGDVDPNVLTIESEPTFAPEPYKSIVRKFIELRYALTPYNYSLAYEQQLLGRPLMRPMFYHFTDTASYRAMDQYMWGENILVAPVMQQGSISKDLYLPAGKWYNYLNNTFSDGGKWISADAGIEEIPIFIRPGAFIPTVDGLKNLDAYSTKVLNILYVPSAGATSYTLYDDDGKTNKAVEKKQFELLQFSGAAANNLVTITIKSNGGNFAGRPSSRAINLTIPGQSKSPSAVLINGKPHKDFRYDADEKMVYVQTVFGKQPIKIEIKN